MTLTVYRRDGSSKTAQTQLVGDAPAGGVMAYAGAGVPSDWLACDGSLIARLAYPDLFNAIGTTYGAGDGSTTFSLPNFPTTLDKWHNIGTVGEPPFLNNWVVLGGYGPVGFRKDPFGRVFLRGTVQSGANATVAFTLPVGYRPTTEPVRTISISNQQAVGQWEGQVNVGTDGNVLVYLSNAAGLISLDQVEFDTESVTAPPPGGLPAGSRWIIRAFPPYKTANLAAPSGIQRVTSLPTYPVDGQQVHYVADAANGILWNLRYNAASVKWEFVGGAALMQGPLGDLTTSSTTGVLLTPSPQITVPLTGRYRIDLQGGLMCNAAASGYAAMNAGKSSSVGVGAGLLFVFQGGIGQRLEASTVAGADLTVGDVISVYCSCANAASNRFLNATLALTPVRIG